VHAFKPNNNDSADLALFANTIALLEAEALEKEEKQQHGMRVRLVRGKLTACRRRSDILLQQLQLSAKSKKDSTTVLFDKLEATEAEIKKLECELVALEERECGRHMQMLEKKRCMALAASIERTPPMIGKGDSFDSFTSSQLESSSSSGGHNESGGNDNIDDDNNGDGSDGSNTTATVTTYNDGTKCMECNTIPPLITCAQSATKFACAPFAAIRIAACKTIHGARCASKVKLLQARKSFEMGTITTSRIGRKYTTCRRRGGKIIIAEECT
jgi:hypothetical protein